MIATLSGRLTLREPDRLIVEAGGVGYEVLVPLTTYYRAPSLGAAIALEIRQVVREESITLYGFDSSNEKRAFDLLMSVQHVGPKLALAVLSVLNPQELAAAITHEDIERLDAVPGVGAKVAERIVRELRDKTGPLSIGASAAVHVNGDVGGNQIFDEAVSALINLGYRPVEAKRAVEAAGRADDESLESLIRKSLAVILGEK